MYKRAKMYVKMSINYPCCCCGASVNRTSQANDRTCEIPVNTDNGRTRDYIWGKLYKILNECYPAGVGDGNQLSDMNRWVGIR